MSTSTEEQKQQVQGAVTDNSTASESQNEAVVKKLEGEELLDAIRKQVEYYFSRQNLANDPFLVQHMNNQLYVPLDFIASFKLIKNLTEDLETIREALKTSKSVIMDETQTKLKPDFTLPRNTVILREVPSSTEIDVVRAIFSPDNLPKQIQSQIGDNWFVVFDTDEQALLALDQIRGKEIDGHAVHARIKTENILKAFTYGLQPQNATQYAPPTGAYGRGGYNPNWQPHDQNAGRGGYGRNPRDNRQGGKKGGPKKKEGMQQQPQQQPGSASSSGAPQQSTQQKKPSTAGGAPYQDQKQQRPKSGKPRQDQPQQQQQQQSGSASSSGAQQSTEGGDNDNRSVGRGKRRPSFSRAHPPPSLASVKNFPPLPAISKAELLKSGYENDKYLAYPKGAIISVYNNNLKNNIQRPADMPADCPAVLSSPKTQLELTKPPLPHHEVQQHPEHVEEGERAQEQDQQQYLQQFDQTTTPKKNSPSSTTTTTTSTTVTGSSASSSSSSNAPTTVAQNELPTIVKSFAEAAITAKDIKTPDFPRAEPKRRNSLKGGKLREEPVAPQKRGRGGRRNSLESGRKGGKNEKEAGAPKRQKEPREKAPKQQGGENTTEEKTKRNKRNKKGNNGEEKTTVNASSASASSASTTNSNNASKEAPVSPSTAQATASSSGDGKSYASIVNKIKDTPSPKLEQHQSSPKTNDSTAQQGTKNASK